MRGAAPAFAVALCAAAGLGGCARAPDPPPAPPRVEVEGPAREIGAVVEALERATAERDYNEVCFELFSDDVRAQAGGVRCPAFLRRTARGIEAPRIDVIDPPGAAVSAIVIRGATATVRVRTRTANQPPVADTIQLVRERGRYRISALGEEKER